MKTINKYITLLIVGIGLFSCSDYLDVVPDNTPTISSVYDNRYTAEQALATCYNCMPRMGAYNENPAWMGALEMAFPLRNQTEPAMQMALGNVSPSSPGVNYWSGPGGWQYSMYFGIRECNTFLENIEGVPDLRRSEKDRMIAEVKLLKAIQHFTLILYYGPMCPQKTAVPVNEGTEKIRVYREKIDVCFEYVLELIDEVIASKALPARISNQTTELGRLTDAAAYALKARVWMFFASPLFNGNTDYQDFLDHNGEPFFNQTYDPSRWEKALAACDEAIKICEANGSRLYQKRDYNAEGLVITDSTLMVNILRSSVTERWNPELIWSNTAFPINSSSGLQEESLPRMTSETTTGNTGRFGVPLATVDLFYSKRGVPIEEDPLYDYTGRHSSKVGDEAHRYFIQEGEATAAMNFDREFRFYSTLGFDRGKWFGNHSDNPKSDISAFFLKGRYGEYSSITPNESDGKYNSTGYWPKKIVSLNSIYRNKSTEYTIYTYPYPDFRLAELYLFYAEALNEVQDAPNADVYKYVDMIRERAGLAGVVESWSKYSTRPDKPTTKAGMREIIRRERRIEFACEAKYYWDARRWKSAPQDLNRLIQGWNVQENTVEGYYTPITIYYQRFVRTNYFFPIPEGDILSNPNLIQNPGY